MARLNCYFVESRKGEPFRDVVACKMPVLSDY